MKPHRITLQDIGPFTDLVDVDLDALARGIVCLAGNNGTGKTIFLESILAGVTRKLPSYGDLADMATSKDAYLQVEFTTKGRRWKARHEIGKGCAYLYNDKGRVLDEKGKIGPFEEWVAENVIPLDVTLASWVRTQESRGFIGLARGDRKSVVLQAKGSEEAARLADRARKRAKALERDLAEKTRAVDAERSRFVPLDKATADRAEAETSALTTAEDARLAEVRLTEAREQRAVAQAAVEQARAQAEVRRRASERVTATKGRLGTVVAREREVVDLLANAEAVELAERDMSEARAARGRLDAELQAATAAEQAADDRLTSARREHATAAQRLRELEALRAELWASAKQRADVEHAAQRAVDVGAHVEANQKRLDVIRAEIDTTRDRAEQMSTGRVERLRGALGEVIEAKAIASARKVATTAIGYDDLCVRGSNEEHLAQLRAESETLAVTLDHDVPLLASLQRRAEFLATVEKAERGIAKLDGEIHAARSAANDAGRLVTDATTRRGTHLAEEETVRTKLAKVDDQIRQLTGLCAKRKQLDQAEALRVELAAQLVQANADIARAEEELAALPPAPNKPVDLAVTIELAFSVLEAEVRNIQKRARDARDALVRAEEALTQAEASAVRLVTLKAEESAVGDELDDVATLAETLGPNGVQALLVDAAGPELAEGMNALLHGSVGPRWTIAVETTRPDARGKREIEAMLLNVTDEVRGLVREARFHCGGERVFMNEAVAIVIASMSGASYGIDGGTLLRDESSAAFRDHNIPLWLAMIRSGLARYGLDRAIVVSHHQEAIDLADQVIEVVDGGLRAVR